MSVCQHGIACRGTIGAALLNTRRCRTRVLAAFIPAMGLEGYIRERVAVTKHIHPYEQGVRVVQEKGTIPCTARDPGDRAQP